MSYGFGPIEFSFPGSAALLTCTAKVIEASLDVHAHACTEYTVQA